jgi:hypothetical protein
MLGASLAADVIGVSLVARLLGALPVSPSSVSPPTQSSRDAHKRPEEASRTETTGVRMGPEPTQDVMRRFYIVWERHRRS